MRWVLEVMKTALKRDVENDSPSSLVSNEASEGAMPCKGTLGYQNEAAENLAMS